MSTLTREQVAAVFGVPAHLIGDERTDARARREPEVPPPSPPPEGPPPLSQDPSPEERRTCAVLIERGYDEGAAFRLVRHAAGSYAVASARFTAARRHLGRTLLASLRAGWRR